jgi:uncharacterized protein YgiM (DUF1202 family)
LALDAPPVAQPEAPEAAVAAITPTAVEILPVPVPVQPAPAEPTLPILFVTSSSLNVREGPSTSFAIVGRLIRNEAVSAVEAPENGWVRIRMKDDDAEGYVAARLLTDQNPN